MTLREKQSIFVFLISKLITFAYESGYELTFGECWRSPEEALRLSNADKGIKNSLHTVRLAIDLLLFKNGKYLTKSTDYQVLGEWWERQSTTDYTCTWGGRFGDGNHFSISHQGKK
jgi:hypothetical protein